MTVEYFALQGAEAVAPSSPPRESSPIPTPSTTSSTPSAPPAPAPAPAPPPPPPPPPPSLSISSVLSSLSLAPFIGREHSGLHDARNISRILVELSRRGMRLKGNREIPDPSRGASTAPFVKGVGSSALALVMPLDHAPFAPHHLVHHSEPYHSSSAPSSSCTSTSSSPPSSTSSPRSSRDGQQELGRAPPSLGGPDDDPERDFASSTTSDSYDSAGEATGVNLRAGAYDSTPNVQYAQWGTDDGASYYSSSRVSSRANSPAPPCSATVEQQAWDGYRSEPLAYRSISRNRSRNVSGTTTPTSGVDKEGQYSSDYYHSHHYQTSALLRKLGGTLTPDNSPVLGQKKRRPGWWTRRAETRRKNHSSTPLGTPTTTPSSSSRSSRNRSCLSTFGAALLRQPWVPTQPLTILFSFLLLGCFAATLTTFLVHVLSSDRQPLFWRQFCSEQRPFPHDLADSLKPVSVFVGVFSVDASVERRNLIRMTWAKHSKPIDPRTGRPTNDIQVKFVLGRPRKSYAKRVALEMEMHNDIIVLDTEENMNKGKTFEYFKWAADNATVPMYYRKEGEGEVGVGFKKADYVVKADEDSFIVLSELERHLRITPRERTYWGYLVRNLFMAGEVYALSSDLVSYVATYKPLLQYTIGKEDQRTAKWMRIHPEYSTIHWVSERCWIYDHPKASTTYSHGFLFPDEAERIKAEGRRGISEEERQRRGGELAPSYSTVSSWKKEYRPPVEGLTIEEQVEALVEGGGRWVAQGWKADGGRGPEAVRRDTVVFDREDERVVDARMEGRRAEVVDTEATGVKPGVPDRSQNIPSARTTRFGKDLFRDPSDVEAVKIEGVKVKRSAGIEERDGHLVEIYNAVKAPWEEVTVSSSSSSSSTSVDEQTTGWTSVDDSTSSSSSSLDSSSSSDLPSSSSLDDDLPSTSSDSAPDNLPTGAVRRPQHNYILPPSSSDRLIPPPTHRYDTTSLLLRSQRMLGLPHGGTVAVHYLKRNEWFYETALALLGRDRTWDGGVTVAHLPPWTGAGNVEMVDAYWGGARMYGSPLVWEGKDEPAVGVEAGGWS
ncbi:hypothetical protein BCR35DRAFT_354380 [Leucosporidium creatinivorum]|uniref:Galactosyltransferase-domain-containing protein n=1 Tax=Leucosporidium creatinivorum TaxID=106004 RepID=A0A1Y2EM41_9BASI|nr:hypothetical protein BCR35DRAFT_354380 [Leucosporidium creatinivorum]